MTDSNLIGLTADIVSAHVSNNDVAASEVASLIGSVHAALAQAVAPAPEIEKLVPAVPVKSSVKHDHIVCLEDGAKVKMLKRYLRTHFDLSPDEYRARWGLPRTYPMVCEAYAKTRSALAIKSGLGREPAFAGSAEAATKPAKGKVMKRPAEALARSRSRSPSGGGISIAGSGCGRMPF
ncbi:MucR family transcriptional regulator [Sphingomonas oryzagri]